MSLGRCVLNFRQTIYFFNDDKKWPFKNSHLSDILSLKMNVKKMTGIFFYKANRQPRFILSFLGEYARQVQPPPRVLQFGG